MQLSGPDPLPPVAAAAVVPLRDGPGGRLQVLVGRRADSMTYGGQWTFPGGRVDERDADPGAPGDELAAARRAAVREAAEEVGLAFPPSALVPFNHWTGGSGTGLRRLFAAWYFLARAPEGTVVLDGRETLDHRWITPADALAARDRGELSVVAPVWMTLHALVGAGSVAGALALAGADGREPVRYTSRLVEAADARVVLWAGDAGYDTGDPDAPGPRHRLVMTDGAGWRSVQRG